MGAVNRGLFIYLPNIISVLRLPIAFAFFAIDSVMVRSVLLSVGALTDALDGWLARRFGLKSKTGALLDPLFDKLFVLIIMSSFLAGPYLGWAGFAILVARDAYVGAAFLVGRFVGFSLPAKSRLSGKIVTFLQMVTLFVLLLAPELIDYGVMAVGVTGGIAIVDYTVVAVRGA